MKKLLFPLIFLLFINSAFALNVTFKQHEFHRIQGSRINLFLDMSLSTNDTYDIKLAYDEAFLTLKRAHFIERGVDMNLTQINYPNAFKLEVPPLIRGVGKGTKVINETTATLMFHLQTYDVGNTTFYVEVNNSQETVSDSVSIEIKPIPIDVEFEVLPYSSPKAKKNVIEVKANEPVVINLDIPSKGKVEVANISFEAPKVVGNKTVGYEKEKPNTAFGENSYDTKTFETPEFTFDFSPEVEGEVLNSSEIQANLVYNVSGDLGSVSDECQDVKAWLLLNDLGYKITDDWVGVLRRGQLSMLLKQVPVLRRGQNKFRIKLESSNPKCDYMFDGDKLKEELLINYSYESEIKDLQINVYSANGTYYGNVYSFSGEFNEGDFDFTPYLSVGTNRIEIVSKSTGILNWRAGIVVANKIDTRANYYYDNTTGTWKFNLTIPKEEIIAGSDIEIRIPPGSINKLVKAKSTNQEYKNVITGEGVIRIINPSKDEDYDVFWEMPPATIVYKFNQPNKAYLPGEWVTVTVNVTKDGTPCEGANISWYVKLNESVVYHNYVPNATDSNGLYEFTFQVPSDVEDTFFELDCPDGYDECWWKDTPIRQKDRIRIEGKATYEIIDEKVLDEFAVVDSVYENVKGFRKETRVKVDNSRSTYRNQTVEIDLPVSSYVEGTLNVLLNGKEIPASVEKLGDVVKVRHSVEAKSVENLSLLYMIEPPKAIYEDSKAKCSGLTCRYLAVIEVPNEEVENVPIRYRIASPLLPHFNLINKVNVYVDGVERGTASVKTGYLEVYWYPHSPSLEVGQHTVIIEYEHKPLGGSVEEETQTQVTVPPSEQFVQGEAEVPTETKVRFFLFVMFMIIALLLFFILR